MEVSSYEENDEVIELITMLKLQVIMLEKERDAIERENAMLKDNVQHIQNILMEQSMIPQTPNKKRMSQETSNKWRFYHNHKNDIQNNHKEKMHWRYVKQETDKLYHSSKSEPSAQTS